MSVAEGVRHWAVGPRHSRSDARRVEIERHEPQPMRTFGIRSLHHHLLAVGRVELKEVTE
jgi:hypothetical protein